MKLLLMRLGGLRNVVNGARGKNMVRNRNVLEKKYFILCCLGSNLDRREQEGSRGKREEAI